MVFFTIISLLFFEKNTFVCYPSYLFVVISTKRKVIIKTVIFQFIELKTYTDLPLKNSFFIQKYQFNNCENVACYWPIIVRTCRTHFQKIFLGIAIFPTFPQP